MATTYKTPGVYIEEIPKFPPSIAPVDTAIPAFIGYTERAVDRDGSDLTNRPKRIESLVEYALYFGGPQLETGVTVTIEETTEPKPGKPVGVTAVADVVEANRSKHILYYAMQLFYANGGKTCEDPPGVRTGEHLEVGVPRATGHTARVARSCSSKQAVKVA